MNDTVRRYVTYGIAQEEFNTGLIAPVSNPSPLGNRLKPCGGLWASSVTSRDGWREFCVGEGFHTYTLDKCTGFHLRPEVRVFEISSVQDAERLKKSFRLECPGIPLAAIDYESVKKHYDAVEITRMNNGVYYAMLPWDCESIAVLNPDMIEIDGKDIELAKEHKAEALRMLRDYNSEYDQNEEDMEDL